MNTRTQTINIPLTLEQLAVGLKQLPKEDWEELDLLLDNGFRQTILERGKIAQEEYQRRETLSVEALKKELDV